MVVYQPPRTELCQNAARDNRGAIVCAVQVTAEGKAPSSIMLFPASDVDGEIKCRDGRVFRMKSAAQFAAAFNADGYPVPFDLDHAIELQPFTGADGAAYGWITSLEERAGAVYANVEWNDEGASLIEAKKYRYVSPAFTVTSTIVDDIPKYEVTSLTSAGLTNRPAMKMPALTHQQIGDAMDPKLLELLGLDEKATKEQVLEAAKALKASAEVEAKATELEVANAKLKSELAAVKDAQPDIKSFVPRADFDAVVARTAQLEKVASDEKAAAHKALASKAIDEAVKAGKVTPSTRDFYEKTCATPEGLADFQAMCAKAPVIAPSNIVNGDPLPASDVAVLTASDREVAGRLGLTDEQFLAAKKTA